MRFLVLATLAVVACTPVASSEITTSTTVPVDITTPTYVVDVPRDTWNGEVEWDLVEQCVLHGLTDCPDTVVELRLGGCTIFGAERYLEQSGLGVPTGEVVEMLHSIGDCPDLTA